MKYYLKISVVILIVLFHCCKDNSSDSGSIEVPPPVGGSTICYEKSLNGHWEIFTNTVAGSNPQNISNYSDDDEYPQWSPDGKYIVYSRSVPANGPTIILFNNENHTERNLTADGGGASLTPKWTPDGKVYFGYPYPWAKYRGTYILSPDSSGRKKILDSTATLYFYQDSYTLLYIVDNKLYKTDIDNTYNEFILDLVPGLNQFLTIRDFNPFTHELLVNTNTIPGYGSAIATYNADTKELNLLLAAENGYMLSGPCYSKDYSMVAFIEINTNTYEERYLSILINGNKVRLVKLTGNESFDYNPMVFSYDGRYIAFSKNVYNDSQSISWTSYLYAVDISNSILYYIDKGICPSWDPH